MPKPADIAKKLDQLAKKIAEEALGNVEIQERMLAFKLLTAYYIGTVKLPSPDDGKNDGDNFDGFRKQIEASGRETDSDTAGTA